MAKRSAAMLHPPLLSRSDPIPSSYALLKRVVLCHASNDGLGGTVWRSQAVVFRDATAYRLRR